MGRGRDARTDMVGRVKKKSIRAGTCSYVAVRGAQLGGLGGAPGSLFLIQTRHVQLPLVLLLHVATAGRE